MKKILILSLVCQGFAASVICQWKAGLNETKVNILPGNEKMFAKALIWVPLGYTSTKKYPLVIYGHGSGQAGEDLSQLYTAGLPATLNNGYRPPFDCIIICPQRAFYSIIPEWLNGIIQDAENRFSIDSTRIYLIGNSAGGLMCYGSQLNISMSLSKKIAAICVLSGATEGVKTENVRWWTSSKTNCWAIVGSEDPSNVRQNLFLVNSLNQLSKGIATLTIRPRNDQGSWQDIYDGSFTENNLNIWQWLYRHKLGSPDKSTVIKTSKRITLRVRDQQVYCTEVKGEYDIQPGDTVIIPTGIKSFLIQHFNGEKDNPVIVMPQDAAWLGGYVNFSGNISHASYFKVTGFHIDGDNATNFGLIINDQTSNFEVSDCHFRNIGSIGLCVKQDPDSTKETGSWPGFSIKNVLIHDITVTHTGTEGFYLGYTFDLIKPLASPIVNLQVYNIKIDSTGWDGLQLSNCQNVSVRNVEISHYGLKNQRGQQGGLLVGGMVTLKDSISNVSISEGTGAGLLIFGRGVMTFSGISFKNVGMSKGENAIFVNDYKDLGFGLPPLQLNMRNIKINGSAGRALVVYNGNKSMLPGTIRNFNYSNTTGVIQDDIDQIIRN